MWVKQIKQQKEKWENRRCGNTRWSSWFPLVSGRWHRKWRSVKQRLSQQGVKRAPLQQWQQGRSDGSIETPESPSPSSVASTVTVSHQKTSIHVRFIRTWLSVVVRLATWLSSGRVAPDRIESEICFRCGRDSVEESECHRLVRTFHFVLQFCFVSAINLFQHQF